MVLDDQYFRPQKTETVAEPTETAKKKFDWKGLLKEALPYVGLYAYSKKDPIAAGSAMDTWQGLLEKKRQQKMQEEEIAREQEREAYKRKLAEDAAATAKEQWEKKFAFDKERDVTEKEQWLKDYAEGKRQFDETMKWRYHDSAQDASMRKPPEDPTVKNLKWEYAQANKGRYDPFTQEFVFPPGVQPMPFEQWVEMNKPAGTVNYVSAQFGSAPEQFQPSGRFKTGKVPTSQKGQFGEIHALRADDVVKKYKSGAGAIYATISGKEPVDEATQAALIARYNKAHGTNHDLGWWMQKYESMLNGPEAKNLIAKQ
jgi:hypothetical protein